MLLTFMIVLVVLLALAGFLFGVDVILNIISVSVAFVAGILTAFGIAALLAIVGWLVVRDAISEIRTVRERGRPWRWLCVGWLGIAGILVDGVIGAWNVYQQHILFSAAVKDIPFAGVPVLVTLASFPVRLVEQVMMRNRKSGKEPSS